MGPNNPLDSATILVADDNPDTTDFIEEVLRYEGYKAVACHSGTEAVNLVKSHAVDLVLLDILMPDLDGMAAARLMKEGVEPDGFLPIIMISALTDVQDKIAALKYADDYVTKPFSETELIARIRSQLRTLRVHRELAHSRRLYQSLYDNVPHMYVSLDMTRAVTNCNGTFCRAVNQEKAAVIGRPFGSFFKPDERDVLDYFLATLAEGTTSLQEPAFSLCPVREQPPTTVSLRAVYVGEHQPGAATVIAMQDITQRVKMEEEQKIARKQLYRSARLASIGTLASGVAHEMNNPLTAILGFSSALLGRMQNGQKIPVDELEEYLKVINSETLRCRDIIENLSNFARERDPRISETSLVEVVNAAIKLIQPRANKRSIEIHSQVGDDVIVRADANKLGQVFINLLSNCLDFCPEGSVVCIEAQVPGGHRSLARVSVADNGPGISPDIMPKVFDPFFTTKEVGKGTGLGLAMCHTIMEECSGSIDIVSEENKGTSVLLEIPLAQSANS